MCSDLKNDFEQTSCCFNKDDSVVATVTSDGKAVFYDAIACTEEPMYY